MEWLSFIGSGIAAFLLVYLAGWLSATCLPTRQNMPVELGFFMKLATGFVAVPSLWAIWYTSGKTILVLGLALFLAALFFIWRMRCPHRFHLRKPNVEWSFLAAGCCMLPLFTLLQSWRNDYFNPLTTNTSYVDFGIFSVMAQYLKTTGVEDPTAWYEGFPLAADGMTQPYHYLDLWFSGFVSDLTTVSPLASYLYVMTPALVTVVYFGMYAWVISIAARQRQEKESLPDWRWAVVALAGVLVSMQIPGLNWSNHLVFNVLLVPKVAPLWVLLPAALLARQQGWAMAECLAVCGLVLSHVLYLPVVAPIFGIVWWFDWRKKRALDGVLKLALLCSTLVGFIIFYCLTGAFETACAAVERADWQSWVYWFVRSAAAQGFKFILFFLPACLGIFLLWQYKKKQSRSAWESFTILAALLLWSGLLSGFTNQFTDHDQFGYLVQTTIASMFLTATAVGMPYLRFQTKSAMASSKAIWALVCLQLIWGALFTITIIKEETMVYSADFLQAAKKYLPGLQPIGVYASNPNSLDTHTSNPAMCLFCNFLPMSGKNLWVNSLTVPESLDDLAYPERRDAVAKSPFFRFNQDLKRQGKYVDYATVQVQFVQAAQVEYLVVEAGAFVPDGLKALAKEVVEDPVSRTKLILLDRGKIK